MMNSFSSSVFHFSFFIDSFLLISFDFLKAALDTFDCNEPKLVILDETAKDLEQYIGEKQAASVVKKAKQNRKKYVAVRQNLKAAEITMVRDVEEADNFDQRTRIYEERMKKAEGILKDAKESKPMDVLIARRNLDLIQVKKFFILINISSPFFIAIFPNCVLMNLEVSKFYPRLYC